MEQVLEQFREEAERDAERRRQLMAIRFYLRDVINECEVGWLNNTFGVTNYRTLLDSHFLAMLSGGLKTPVQVMAVCGGEKPAHATLDRLRQAGIHGDFQADSGGFTDFVVSRRIVPFLKS